MGSSKKKSSSKKSSGSSSSSKSSSRFVKGKGGTVKDTETGRTIVPRAEKGETQASIIKNLSKSSGSSSSGPSSGLKEVITKIQKDVVTPQAKEAIKKASQSKKPSTAENIVRSRVLSAIKENKAPTLTAGRTPQQQAINQAITESFAKSQEQLAPLVAAGGKVQVKGKDIIVTQTPRNAENPRFFDTNTQTFFPDEPNKTAFLVSQARRPVDRSILTSDRLQRIANENQRRAEENSQGGFISSTLRGATKVSENLRTSPSLLRQQSSDITELGAALITRDASSETQERISEISSRSRREAQKSKDILTDPDVLNFATTSIALSLAPISIAKFGGKNIIQGIGTPLVQSTAARETVKGIGQIATSRSTIDLENDLGFRDATLRAEAQTRADFFKGEKLEVKDFVNPLQAKGFRDTLPSATEFSTTKEFKANVRNQLILEGFKGKDLDRAVRTAVQQRAFTASSELAGTLATEATTERIGSRLTQSFTKPITFADQAPVLVPLGGKSLKREAFRRIAPLGAGEGISELFNQRQSNNQDTNLFEIAAAGVVGGKFAGEFGAGLIAARNIPEITGRRALGAVLDLAETPGDFISDISGDLAKGLGFRKASNEVADVISSGPVLRGGRINTISTTSQNNKGLNLDTFLGSSTKTQTKVNTLSSEFQTSNFFTNFNLPELGNPNTTFTPELPTSGNLFKNEVTLPNLNTNLNKNSLGFPTNTNFEIDLNLPTKNVNLNKNVTTNVTNTALSLKNSLSTSLNLQNTLNTTFVNKLPSLSSSTNIPTLLVPGFRLPKLESGKKGKKGYVVKVKEKGKFKTISPSLPKQNAFNLGKYVTDNSSAAQFKITKSNKKAKRPVLVPFTPNSKFRKKNNSFIEKKSKRIDTLGEIRGIKAKGLLKQRFKRL